MNHQPFLQAHCQTFTRQTADQSFVKELEKPTQEKRNFKNAPPHDEDK